ncbi:ferredoxin-type protein NapG [Helicobacter enhydrae]|uniref:Ferredoxin-type protein NapG n=1 Tax=Helicobacter enhydrae TaxID=222136 RepID=A0A1B1U4G4_9HELI|nr:ferredoxin-type protein NapG [Helicobacter enhydrae]ANV97646.1 ferredoxin-type protein NapG [Helicobacter enhydrae]
MKFDWERREALKKGVGSLGVLGAGAMIWSEYLNAQVKQDVLRPPGAKKDFLSHCIRCGLCVEACPYLTLKLAEVGNQKGISAGTPYFEPRKIPCYMCQDIPCMRSCPSGALSAEALSDAEGQVKIDYARMGVAVIDTTHCIAYGGIQCDACYRACPLIKKALYLKVEHNDFTDKHSKLLPMVDAEFCTGCGMCERACVTQKPTIVVLPYEKVMGAVGDHYIRSWKQGDETRINQEVDSNPNKTNSLDYLNNGEF